MLQLKRKLRNGWMSLTSAVKFMGVREIFTVDLKILGIPTQE